MTRRTGPTWPTSWARPPARYALEVAAAGGHHLLHDRAARAPARPCSPSGCPGCCRRSTRGGLEVTAVHSVAGTAGRRRRAAGARPPFQAPHHTASVAAIVGGGSGLGPAGRGLAGAPRRAVPGRGAGVRTGGARRTAAAAGVRRGHAGAGRRRRSRFPARFQLVLAANPCPCGLAGGRWPAECTCTPMARRRYLGRLSGPLLDRVDLRIEMHAATRADLRDRGDARGDRGRRRIGSRPPGSGWRAGSPGRRGGSTPRCPVTRMRRLWRLPLGGRRRGRAPARPGRADRAGCRPGGAGRLDAGRSRRARPAGRRRRPAGARLPGGGPVGGLTGSGRPPADERSARAALTRLAEPATPGSAGRSPGWAPSRCSSGSAHAEAGEDEQLAALPGPAAGPGGRPRPRRPGRCAGRRPGRRRVAGGPGRPGRPHARWPCG